MSVTLAPAALISMRLMNAELSDLLHSFLFFFDVSCAVAVMFVMLLKGLGRGWRD